MPDPRSGWSVVLAPGGNNSAQIPLLMYSRLAAQRRGASVEVVTWEFGEDRGISQQRGMVTSTVEAAVGAVTAATGAVPLVIGKSLGSLAAPVAAERGLAAEIESADHAMFMPGPLAASVSVLGQVLAAVEEFLDHAVWPMSAD